MSWDDVELPDGWKVGTIGDVAKVVGGGTPKTAVPGNFSDMEGHPWLTPADLTGYTRKYIRRGRRFLTDQGLATSSATYLPAGSVLFSSRAPIGYVAIAEVPITTNQGFRSLVPSDELDPEYLYYALKYLRPVAEHMASGTTFAEISGSKVARLPLAYPPLEEQRRIVAYLDTAASKGSSAASHLEVAHQAIDRFRQVILATAYRAASDSVEGNGLVALDTLLREPLRNGYSARPVNRTTPYRVLTLTATTSGWFDGSQFKYTDEQFPPDSPFWLVPGDLVVQRGNTAEYVGVPALYDGPPSEYLYPDLMIRVRVCADIDPRFVWYMLLAPQVRNFLRERATGSAGNMPKINQTSLSQVPVPLPGRYVRQQIVERLDRAISLADSISRHLDVASRRVANSTQAVLAKAFRGEIMPRQPDTSDRQFAFEDRG